MARHFKNGLDYFSHDCTMKNDIKIKLLKAKYKVLGYGVFNLLLEDIYSNSFYLNIDDDYILMFSHENGVEESVVKEMINFMIDKKLFDKHMYEKYSILTSERTQRTYLLGCTRRKKVVLNNKYLLLSIDEITNCSHLNASEVIYVNINNDNVNINGVNADINSQTKLNYTKLNETKLNEIEIKTKDKNKEDFLNLIPDELDNDNFKSSWLEWVKFRKEVKSKLTESTAIKQLKFLTENKDDAIEIINKSIQSGWKGLFEINKSKIHNNGTYKQQRNTLQDFS